MTDRCQNRTRLRDRTTVGLHRQSHNPTIQQSNNPTIKNIAGIIGLLIGFEKISGRA
jgi:hypothetical protein|tara:strand:+ start:15346 stop:15516 length:171 start_codon:yes stop_codon:yes gene_type:complete